MTTRQILINNYLQTGLELGFDNVKLKMISDRTGIEKASVYSHFRSFDNLKQSAVEYCISVLEQKNITIDFKAKDMQTMFIEFLNNITESFTEFPLNCYIGLIEQKKLTDKKILQLSTAFNSMLYARILVAFDYSIQRTWINISDTDIYAEILTPFLRNLIVKSIFPNTDKTANTDNTADYDNLLAFFDTIRYKI